MAMEERAYGYCSSRTTEIMKWGTGVEGEGNAREASHIPWPQWLRPAALEEGVPYATIDPVP